MLCFLFSCCTYFYYPLVIFLTSYAAYKIFNRFQDKEELKSIIFRKQIERKEKLSQLRTEYKLNEEHRKILNLNDEELIEKLQKRELTASLVLNAFIAKAIQVTDDLNCVTEFVPQAVEWAGELDNLDKVKGPLHGLPVTIKDNCSIKGMDSTLGLGKRLYKPAEDHAVLVKVLLDLGAVPFCKTNIPQTLFSFNCQNPVFGVTKNPLNPQLTPGGSSGGESALIGAGGSIVGIGSDIGGSVRIPAHFTGIVGYKSTKDRLSSNGFQASLPNIVGLVPVPGLLARNTRMLIKLFQSLVEEKQQQKYDPLSIPIGFDHKILSSTSKLRIGYYTSLPFFPLLGDSADLVMEGKKALEEQGHTLIPFDMPDSYEMGSLCIDFSWADGGSGFLKSWKHEPVSSGLYINYILCCLPIWIRRSLAMLIDGLLPFQSNRVALMLRGGARTSEKLWERIGDRKKMLEGLMRKWRELDLDLLLCPTLPFPAIPNEMPIKLQPAVCYTMIYNLFDLPCGVVPFGKETGSKVKEFKDEGDFVFKTAKKCMDKTVGMPLSLQLVGLPYEDEKVLRGMQILESISQKKINSN